MFNGAGAGNSCSISRRPSAGSSCSISSAFFDDRLADDVTALAQLRVLYSDRARSSNQWQGALYYKKIIRKSLSTSKFNSHSSSVLVLLEL